MATYKTTVEGGYLITTGIRNNEFKSQISRISNEPDRLYSVDSHSFRQTEANSELNRFTSISVTICERLKDDNYKFIQLLLIIVKKKNMNQL
jgi:hypothetical protein